MKKLLLSLFLILLTLGASPATQPRRLQVRWGVENIRYRAETNRNVGRWSNIRTVSSRLNARDGQVVGDCDVRHHRLWDSYVQECEAQGKAPDEGEFRTVKKTRDSFCWGVAQKDAPTLYFDFVAPTADQYTLEEISVETLYRGKKGPTGFIENEAWYDIVLPGQGNEEYPLRRRLIFKNNGRTHLRFWNGGAAAICVIKINFKFQVTGKFETVTVGPLALDL